MPGSSVGAPVGVGEGSGVGWPAGVSGPGEPLGRTKKTGPLDVARGDGVDVGTGGGVTGEDVGAGVE